MENQQFFLRIIDDYWKAKNNAEKEAQVIARELDCTIIEQDDLESIQNQIRDKIHSINNNNPRCKDLKIDFWTSGIYSSPSDNDYKIIGGIPNVFRLEIIKIKNHYNANFK